METWKECYEHFGCSARNYSVTDCINCPHKDEDIASCNIKRRSRKAGSEYVNWLRKMTNRNAN